jgi:hypothetical protein
MVGALPRLREGQAVAGLHPAGRLQPGISVGTNSLAAPDRINSVLQDAARGVHPFAQLFERDLLRRRQAFTVRGRLRALAFSWRFRLVPAPETRKFRRECIHQLTSFRSACLSPIAPFACSLSNGHAMVHIPKKLKELSNQARLASWRRAAETNAHVAFLSQLPDAAYDNGVNSLNGLKQNCRQTATMVTQCSS